MPLPLNPALAPLPRACGVCSVSLLVLVKTRSLPGLSAQTHVRGSGVLLRARCPARLS